MGLRKKIGRSLSCIMYLFEHSYWGGHASPRRTSQSHPFFFIRGCSMLPLPIFWLVCFGREELFLPLFQETTTGKKVMLHSLGKKKKNLMEGVEGGDEGRNKLTSSHPPSPARVKFTLWRRKKKSEWRSRIKKPFFSFVCVCFPFLLFKEFEPEMGRPVRLSRFCSCQDYIWNHGLKR